MNQNSANPNRQELVSTVLNSIPAYDELAKSQEEIASSVAAVLNISYETAEGLTASVLAFLELFGILHQHENLYRIRSGIPYYFSRSLDWYFRNSQELLSNWERKGTAREIRITNLLEMAPYFLKIMEEKRCALSESTEITPGYSRYQVVAFILIKSIRNGKTYFLHRWDPEAERYQLIGGKQRANEHHFETATRELNEEITEHDLKYGRDYEFTLLNRNEEPVKFMEVSKTYGALTLYEFWLYGIEFELDQLRLSEIDRWISLDEMRNGITSTRKPISNPELCRKFDANIPSGLEGVPTSISIQSVRDYRRYFEVNPGIFGVTFDVKSFLQDWWQKRKGKNEGCKTMNRDELQY